MAIYVATERRDLRCSFDGLAGVVREVLRDNPLSGALFMFFNKSADRVKILWWDRTGFCLLYKRLGVRVERDMTLVAIEAASLCLCGHGARRGRPSR